MGYFGGIADGFGFEPKPAEPFSTLEEVVQYICLLKLAPLSGRQAVQAAIKFAAERHVGQTRPGGESQMDHVMRVAIAVAEYAAVHCPDLLMTLVVCALLHDVLEDTLTTDDELTEHFGEEVAKTVRALSHVEEEELDEIYLARVAAGGYKPVLVKRYDKLDNLSTLKNTPLEFRARKVMETRAALPIWQRIDPDAVPLFEAVLLTFE